MSAIKCFVVVYTLTRKSVLDYKQIIIYHLLFFLAVKYQEKKQTEFVLEQTGAFNIWTLAMGMNRVIVETVQWDFDVLLTVYLSMILANDQLDAQFLYFIIRLLQSSTCFGQRRANHQEVKFY